MLNFKCLKQFHFAIKRSLIVCLWLFRSGSQISSPEVVLKRLQSLARNGPLFALSFLAFWVAWAHPSLQFLICLCLYDGFLTLVDLNYNALLADLAVSASERTRLNFHSSLFSALGSLSVFLSYSFWDKEDFMSFRLFCVALAVLSVLGFAVVSRVLHHRFQNEVRSRKNGEGELLREYVQFLNLHFLHSFSRSDLIEISFHLAWHHGS